MARAKIIADSISESGIRITTLELEYPLFIHAQAKTHRIISINDVQYELMQSVDLMDDKMLSRSAQSSRAVPTEKKIKLVKDLPPPNFQQNQAGMQSSEPLVDWKNDYAIQYWNDAKNAATQQAYLLADLGVHKQWSNRLIEPFSTVKVVVTATEWDNFFALRLHHAAQPEMQDLAQAMKTAMDESNPDLLQHFEWHLPYVDTSKNKELTFEQLALISAARCARVSYLNHDNSNPEIEKDLELAQRLLADKHLSPFEHQARPMDLNIGGFTEGQTHMDKSGDMWSGNFNSWIQHRQLVDL